MSPRRYSEDALIEQPTIALFEALGWETVNAYNETLRSSANEGTLGRDNQGQTVLTERLRQTLVRLNPEVPAEAIDQAVERLADERALLDVVRANRDIHHLLRDGVTVNVRQDDGSETPEAVRVIDWQTPDNNDFLLVSQLWIVGDMYKRRADLVGFVNGLPLLFVELKGAHRNLADAYRDNLTDYRDTIPAIFRHNAFILLSNGSESLIGTLTSTWEHFSTWKKISSEEEAGIISLETILRGTCEKHRFLDIVENFTAFKDGPGGTIKLIAKNHQYLGVNNAIERLGSLSPEQARKLGVFWHTQGSGKTMSMLLFSQKVLRTEPGNWTFVIVTDREDLDDQLHKEFTDANVLGEGHVQATSGAHLRELLGEDHRYVFTLIQKFHVGRGETYPRLTDRSDVIVMTDEAHRTQYDTFAKNMRAALPNASFLGFTGTPLMAGEEATRREFGDYVSVYNFSDSVQDGATVPLYYENRIPELQLENEQFGEEFTRILEDAQLDEAQEAKVARHFGREYHLITRNERLDRIAEDLVEHFLGRGFMGKAMMISVDKPTTIRMYDKVRAEFDRRLAENRERLARPESRTEQERAALESETDLLANTDMAVVVSAAQNEVGDMRQRGLDIAAHRQRMVREDLDAKFKDAADPLRLVFLCAMWTTGFDVPSCSTIYLDKPMKNHTLMQTIARANRVFPDKNNGLIVDYIGVFRKLEQALAIYGAPQHGGGTEEDDKKPVEAKEELLGLLRKAVDESSAFCARCGVDLGDMVAAEPFRFVHLAEQAVEKLLATEETKNEFLSQARLVERLYRSVLPDEEADEFTGIRDVLRFVLNKILSLGEAPDISHVEAEVEALLDRSVAANAYIIRGSESAGENHRIDLSGIDFERLAERFAQSTTKRSELEKLRTAVAAKAKHLARLNPTRTDWLEKFQEMIDEYNAGSVNVEEFFRRLVEFTRGLDEEEQRSAAQGLTEEQLAVYDLLTRPGPDLSEVEERLVKQIAEELLDVLKREKLVLDWRKRQQSRAAVRHTIETVLDEQLPQKYEPAVFEAKCDVVYEHVYDSYFDDLRSVYAA